jgi:sensor histidine kinase YesM
MSKKVRIGIEVVFFILLYFPSSYEPNTSDVNIRILSLCIYLVLYLHTAVNRVFIFKFLFPKKQIFKYLSLTLINLTAFAFLHKYMCNKFGVMFLKKAEIASWYDSFSSLLLSYFILASIEFFFQYLKIVEDNNQKEKLYHELETNNLKAQLNPHFLFNSLNNAYGLSLSQPDKVPDYIMSLSQLMRYQIESIKKELISLSDEITFIENYTTVEKQRVGTRCTIDFEYQTNDNESLLAPLILFSFIENAIKHSSNSIEASYVNIKLKTENNLLIFTCENSIPNKKMPVYSTSTGLINVKERLKHFDPKHKLEISTSENVFLVQLDIHLKENQ